MSFPLSGVADPFAGCPPTPPPISPDPQYTDEDDGDQSQTNKYKYPFEVAEEVCRLGLRAAGTPRPARQRPVGNGNQDGQTRLADHEKGGAQIVTGCSSRYDVTKQARRAYAGQACKCPTCGAKARRETCTVYRPSFGGGFAKVAQSTIRCLRTSGGERCPVLIEEVRLDG